MEEKIDYIDRYTYPSYGNGPVFIAHTTMRSEMDKLHDGWYYNPELTRYRGVGDKVVYPGLHYTVTVKNGVETTDMSWVEGSEYHGVRSSGYVSRANRTVTHFVYHWDTGSYTMGRTTMRNPSLEDIRKGPTSGQSPSGTRYGPYYGAVGNYVLRESDPLKRLVEQMRSTLANRIELGYFTDGREAVGYAEAYFNALDNLPQLATNNIANLAQLVDSVRLLLDIYHGDLASLPRDMKGILNLSKEAWLAYRYSYLTTKSDIEELAMYAQRIDELANRCIEKINVKGQYVDAQGYVYGCSFDVETRSLMPASVRELLSSRHMMGRAGLALDLENAWDLVPFSFVVDWFVPIGDWLHKITTKNECLDLIITNHWYTKHGTETVLESEVRFYQRFPGHGHYTGIPQFRTHHSKATTWAMRAGDVFSLAT
jgi:hypothetical protein